MTIEDTRSHPFIPPKGGAIVVYGYAIVSDAQDFGEATDTWSLEELRKVSETYSEAEEVSRVSLSRSVERVRELGKAIVEGAQSEGADVPPEPTG